MVKSFLKQFNLEFNLKWINRQAILLTACFSILLVTSNVQAGHGGGLHIDAASWDGATLTADGGADKPKRGGGPVEIFDADTSVSLGLANLPNSGNWDYSGTTCADNIYVTQDGLQTAAFPVSGPGCGGGGNTPPFANDDAYNATKNTVLNISAPGVLDNDTDADNDPLTAIIDMDVTFGSLVLNSDGSFEYTPDSDFVGEDSFSYFAHDGTEPSASSALVTITVTDVPEPPVFLAQTDFKIMMNYELGMHCTGFEFAYCCVLPAYNSILSQVVKPGGSGTFPELLEGDPNVGLDALGRETVIRDRELDANGNFKKYVLKYWHDAQPRNDGRGKPQTSTLISSVEGNSLLSWNTVFDSAALNPDGSFVTGTYNGADGVILGDGTLGDPADNYQNAVWNHLYFYDNLEGDNSTENVSAEIDKIRLGVNGHVVYPTDCGAALHPMGPTSGGVANDCGGFSNGNVLTFSGDKGTVVYTQMKVLENLPVMLTSPDIWEALGLPLTPFEDSIDFFGDPGLVDEDSVRPYVAMKAQLYEYDGAGNNNAVIGSTGEPVIGFGTAPIDIPNCERCHSNGPGTVNTPNSDPAQWAMVQDEYNFWNAYYNIDTGAGDSDWYSRLKSAAISMLNGHDIEHGTSFAANYPSTGAGLPQNTRLGHESVICQRCHADNVIAVVKSATHNGGEVIKPITEAIHLNHRGVSSGGEIAFSDAEGRDGGCQGCHPAHRSDGDMSGYPITLGGENFYADADNRDANGGCFVGRDVHSNPGKDTDGAETPEHLNAVGQWLSDNVYSDQGASGDKGIWCTNCHNQLGQEIWKTENMEDLVHGIGITNPRAEPTLAAVAAMVGTTEDQAIAWLDPRDTNALGDFTHAIWEPDPGLCNYVAGYFGVIPVDPDHDGNVATVEVNVNDAASCSTGGGTGLIDCGAQYPGAPAFHICGSTDVDGDFSVSALDFCTTEDCVSAAQGTLPAGSVAVPVPFSAATDGRDHWLSAGEPHCADCHAAPYVEQSGNIDAFPPFNYPRKASLMRYSRGHQDITCQGCHESIHGLYPVTPTIDTTSYAQAAALNHDGSHGPLKCGTCHEVDGSGIPSWMSGVKYNGKRIRTFDDAVSWAHTFTKEVSPLEPGGVCENCHQDRTDKIAEDSGKWLRHAHEDRIGRKLQDRAEIDALGDVAGGTFVDADDAPGLYNTVCAACHGLQGGPGEGFEALATCDNTAWLSHNIDGRLSEKVWEFVSETVNASTCGW